MPEGFAEKYKGYAKLCMGELIKREWENDRTSKRSHWGNFPTSQIDSNYLKSNLLLFR